MAAMSHDDFGGLDRDLAQMFGRRRALALLGGAGLAGLLAGCRSTDTSASPTTAGGVASGGTSTTAVVATAATTAATTSASTPTATAGPGEEIPSETGGPYPADGTNGPNVLTTDGVVRSDLTSSFGTYSGSAAGIPITFELTVLDSATGAALADHALYLWHCTADGKYSLYEVTDQNYLRGLQVTDAGGKVTFTSVFPGCYRGRWPHVHFEVYDALANATSGNAAVKTSQLAMPDAECVAVYADDRYGDSTSNLAALSLDTDGIFQDGYDDQLATLQGDPATGYTATLTIRI
jgi:protocatechuate 3,4-dioxygenase beta subunit